MIPSKTKMLYEHLKDVAYKSFKWLTFYLVGMCNINLVLRKTLSRNFEL